ncbi:CPBP family glutamic-type intramembrane protease [Serratia fonticola]|uniref:CPBP family glutamic-type intramembrane protease n=1 Tax=Serratia fonticola TaxID=47917 RepID=UPI001AE90433|nr:CPBP family glutamic-type intramembrane protease [Serratia fonticola]MBP1000296.1 CPBP family intramembrane metalloprotease [Serratia fonticola]MBP1005307.1 CPBP family intramembrane metalloprotease [Serratia fonticola]MBP1014961.1 CPBP family intramembrane metalloprotease [Serratia fonticola]MBP1020160.1 CPBP family intramembrane metalloprotease [Serratia fonticola]
MNVAPLRGEHRRGATFRGCLFSALLQVFRGHICLSALMTSITFAILHTQYSDIRTLVILAIVSLILIAARIASKGLAMPIMLHMLINGFVLMVGYHFS